MDFLGIVEFLDHALVFFIYNQSHLSPLSFHYQFFILFSPLLSFFLLIFFGSTLGTSLSVSFSVNIMLSCFLYSFYNFYDYDQMEFLFMRTTYVNLGD